MGWCLTERLEKKHYNQRCHRSAVCVLFGTRKSWSQRQTKLDGTWTPHLVMDGLEWFATTRYLTSLGDWSLNWYDQCVYIDAWAACKILHDVEYSTFDWQKSNRNQSNCQPQAPHDTCLFKSWGTLPKKIHHSVMKVSTKLCCDIYFVLFFVPTKLWSVCCDHDKWLVPNPWLARPVMRCPLGPRRWSVLANDCSEVKNNGVSKDWVMVGVKIRWQHKDAKSDPW